MRTPTRRESGRGTAREGIWLPGAAVCAMVLLGGCGTAAGAPETSAAPGSAPQSAAATPAPNPRSFRLVVSGDPLLHEDFFYQARKDAAVTGKPDMDFAPLLANTKAVVESADLAICHMETSIGPDEGPFSGYPLFSSPPQIITALKETGYDFCTTASNHSFDTGAQGIDQTLGKMDAAGIGHVGSARTQAEADTPAITTVSTANGPVKVANLAYAFGFNGLPYPNDETWRANIIDVPKILADARKAKAAGADVVVLNMHWGTEYQAEPDADQVAQANALTASPDIDIILGGHAHVVQPIQKINNKWVMFGTGNLFGCHRDFGDPDEEGVMGRFTFTEKPGGGFEASNAEYLPILATCTFDGDSRVMNIPVALATADYGAYGRDRLELAQARTTATVDSLGGSGQGLQPLTQ